MQIGVHTPPLADERLESALPYLDGLGVDAIEPGVGGHPGQDHLVRSEYLDDETAQAELRDLLAEYETAAPGEIGPLATEEASR